MAQNNAAQAEQKPVYWYFGIVNRVNGRDVVAWGKNSHATAIECVKANVEFMAAHPGRRHIVQRFDHLINTSAPE